MTRRTFKDAVVLVTGAGGGLGRALAERFAAAGARIAALDRDAAGIESLRSELATSGKECLALPCDVTDPAACASAVEQVLRRYGQLDALVNNAGLSHRSAFAETSLEVVRRVMDVNFFGSVHCTKASLPHLLASRGLVVSISSVAGYTPLLARTGYAASKHAMHGFFESLRTEVAPHGVDVMLACPSFISTRIGVNAMGGDGLPVRHAQVTVGKPLTPAAAAERIVTAAARGRQLVFVGHTARLAWWVSRLSPALYARLMARRVRGELESVDAPAGAGRDRGPEA